MIQDSHKCGFRIYNINLLMQPRAWGVTQAGTRAQDGFSTATARMNLGALDGSSGDGRTINNNGQVAGRAGPAATPNTMPPSRARELMYSSCGGNGPIAVFELAVYPGYRNRADVPAVAGCVPVISHHETLVLRHGDFRKIRRGMGLRDKDAIYAHHFHKGYTSRE